MTTPTTIPNAYKVGDDTTDDAREATAMALASLLGTEPDDCLIEPLIAKRTDVAAIFTWADNEGVV